MRPVALAILIAVAVTAFPAAAQTVVTSARPDRVAVTLYRDPQRPASEGVDSGGLGGYALITETRTVTLPAGETELRFEGVAGGIVPQSAIVAGFPQGIVERNRDARLLAPDTLLNSALGRRVTVRRTSHATGRTTETEAVIRSGADGAVVLQTREGAETLRCTGLNETLVYPSLPPGLSARPTLSVRTRSARPVTATVTLAYLASGFDWRANYVAQLSTDGTSVELLAWLTLASEDETSFPGADVQAIAGNLHREEVAEQPREGGSLRLQCWPAGTTSDIPLEQLQHMSRDRGVGFDDGQEVVITGSRIPSGSAMLSPVAAVMATQENLGDLKLYRLPEPVTLAANSRKQVAFMTRDRVRVRLVYRDYFSAEDVFRADEQGLLQRVPPTRLMVTRNRAAEGLGLPLPAGGLVLFGQGPDRPILLGEGSLDDRAIGEDVEVELGPAPTLVSRLRMLSRQEGMGQFELIVTNDRAQPVAFEGVVQFEHIRANARFGERGGWPLWQVTIPANGRAVLCFRANIPDDFRTYSTKASGGTCGR